MKYTLFLLTIAISILFISCEDNNTDPKDTKRLSFEDNTPAGRNFVSEGLVIDDIISMTIPIKNTSSSNIDLKAKIEIIENVGGIEANFCLGDGNCVSLTDGIKEVSNTVSLVAGSTANEELIKLFIAPNQTIGSIVTNITLWDANNPDDVVTVSATIKSSDIPIKFEEIANSKNGFSSDYELAAYFRITNSGKTAVRLSAGIRNPLLSFGHTTAICWGDPLNGGTCYSPVTYEFDTPTDNILVLQPGETTGVGSFVGYVYPNNFAGVSNVSFIVWNADDPRQSVIFPVEFNFAQ